MITIDDTGGQPASRRVRKATLTKKAVAELRRKIDRGLREEGPRRLGPSAVNFLKSIREIAVAPEVRLSKRQRDVTEEILEQACSGVVLVVLGGEAIADLAKLISDASGNIRVSAFEENIMASLKPSLCEPIIAVSERRWRIIEDIKRIDLSGKLPLDDPDGLVDDEDPDGIQPERDEADIDRIRQWELVGIDPDED